MTTHATQSRVGALQAIGQGFRAGIKHWRWLSLSAVFALLLGGIASLPLTRQLKASLGFNPAGASTDPGDRIQAWVETLRSLAGNAEGMAQFVTGLLCCVIVAWLLKTWLASGLVGSVRSGRGLGYRELIRISNAGFWPQLKQNLLFVVIFVLFALPVFFTFKWVQAVRKTAIAAAQVEQANLVFYLVALLCLFLFALWLEIARANLANADQTSPRIRSSVAQGLKTMFKRPFAVILAFVLFLALGLAALALISMPVSGIANPWLSAVIVALATMVGGAFRAMRLESLARVAR